MFLRMLRVLFILFICTHGHHHILASHEKAQKMTPVGFEPTQLALVELESTPLDHSGKVSWSSKSH